MKAYILKTKNPLSDEYATVCGNSCVQNKTSYEFLDWWHEGNPKDAWASIGIPIGKFDAFKASNAKAQFATSGHAMIWKKIRDSGQPGIVLEHDAIMLHPIDIEIPDDMIVVLGYKLQNPQEYDHIKAGPPHEIVDIPENGHEGAHAYAITHNTAQKLLDEIADRGVPGAIDNTHFLKSRSKHTKIPIKIMSPTPALGWLRESTIWKKSAARNYRFISSFQDNYTKI